MKYDICTTTQISALEDEPAGAKVLELDTRGALLRVLNAYVPNECYDEALEWVNEHYPEPKTFVESFFEKVNAVDLDNPDDIYRAIADASRQLPAPKGKYWFNGVLLNAPYREILGRGRAYWIPKASEEGPSAETYRWVDSAKDRGRMRHGECFKTQKDAIAWAKAAIGGPSDE